MSSNKEDQLTTKESILHGVERILWWTRYLVFFGIASCMIAAIVITGLCVLETREVSTAFYDLITNDSKYCIKNELIENTDNLDICNKGRVIKSVVKMIDYFLISCILLIFSFGIYELFISRIDPAGRETRGKILNINNVDELKSKLIKMILVILVVKFFSIAYQDNFDDALKLAAGIALIGVMVFFTRHHHPAHNPLAESSDEINKEHQ